MKMDSLKYTALIRDQRVVDCDRKFYDHFDYSTYISLKGMSCLRRDKTQSLPNSSEIVRRWGFRRWSRVYVARMKGLNNVGSWNLPSSEAADTDGLNRLISFRDWLDTISGNYKLVVGQDHGYFYTNDLEEIRKLVDGFDIAVADLRRANVVFPRDTVTLNNSQHNYRSYFRERWLERDKCQLVAQYLLSQQHMRLAPSLRDWAQKTSRSSSYTRSHWFVDHSDARDLFMMELVVPNLVRKTIPIIKVNN